MFSRLINIIKGFFGLFIKGLESSNPRALIEAEKENLRKQIARFNENLANHAAFVERLNRQVKTLQQKEKELTAKITANIKAGNRAAAGQLALQLQTVKQQLQENSEQLQMADKTFRDLEKSRDVTVREAQAKIEKLQNMITETEMLNAQAELQEMAKGMISSIGTSGDTLNRAQEIIMENRDKAAGKARVAASQGLDTSEIVMKENEQAALGDQALAEFAAAYGIDMNSGEATGQPGQVVAPPVTEREMGPK